MNQYSNPDQRSRSHEQNNVTQVINNHYPEAPAKKVTFLDARNFDETLRDRIEAVKVVASEPSKDVIDFRNELRERFARTIYMIPTKHLRFRKNNGRIIADVESYESEADVELDEGADQTQELLRGFLAANDRQRNDQLKRLLSQTGQQRPAIATCDGFLINGNRRKMALEELYRESNQKEMYQMMRVILLPEDTTELEIQKIENRYQLQSEGKAEYQVLNRAIKYKRNIESGFSLEAQLQDDPNYHQLSPAVFRREVKAFEKKFIHPLACIDRYLVMLGREGMYTTISDSMHDKEGRWRAFVRYSAFYYGTLANPDKLRQLGLHEEEVEDLEKAVFKVIRKRNLSTRTGNNFTGTVGDFIGNLPKYIQVAEARERVMEIAGVPDEVPAEFTLDENGKRYSDREIDSIWGAMYEAEIIGRLSLAHSSLETRETRDKPLELLEDTLRMLSHNNLKIKNMGRENYIKGMELMQVISRKAEEIYQSINQARYEDRGKKANG